MPSGDHVGLFDGSMMRGRSPETLCAFAPSASATMTLPPATVVGSMETYANFVPSGLMYGAVALPANLIVCRSVPLAFALTILPSTSK